MIASLKQWDEAIFLFLNGLNHPVLDSLMVFISGKLEWLPLYLLLLYFVIRQYKWNSIRLLIFVAVLISLSDQVSVKLFKDVFMRPRPCHEPHLQELIHLVSGKCGGRFGFVSSHAANSFSLALFMVYALRPGVRWIGLMLWPWAIIVSYSRIYLGVHYPGDVLVGAMLGLLVGWTVWKAYVWMGRRYCGDTC